VINTSWLGDAQTFEFLQEGDKYRSVVRLLEKEMDGSRILIFCETKRGCDAVTRQLRTDGWPALSIHGDKSQQERDWVLAVWTPFVCQRAVGRVCVCVCVCVCF
jgi:superfamily II DNA/RNA helicase